MIRTFLNYFLERDLGEVRDSRWRKFDGLRFKPPSAARYVTVT
ncbi:hypothetical protein [Rhizobium sp. TH2]